MSSSSETNWARLDALTDETIDTSDIPALAESFFSRASMRAPQQRISITLQLDPDVLAWFRSQGPEWERYVNAALRLYAEAHKAYDTPRAAP